MNINDILTENGMTKYRLAKLSGIPHATLNDICSGKTRIEKCSGETLYKLAKVLSVSIETLMESAMVEQSTENSIERSYEYGLPGYLQKDLDAYKDALENGSTLLDCLWGELGINRYCKILSCPRYAFTISDTRMSSTRQKISACT